MFRKNDPGDSFSQQEVYEVWGDVIAYAVDDQEKVIANIERYLQESYLADFFDCHLANARDGRQYLVLQWGEMKVEIDARPFGEHLDVYAILAIRKGLIASPDPAARVANLSAPQRRDLQLFQTILKQAIEETLEALDDGTLH